MKLNKILPIAFLGCSLPTMVMIPTSCKDNNNKQLTQAQWADAFAYFDFNNKTSNYKMDITLNIDYATPSRSEVANTGIEVESIGLNKYIYIRDLDHEIVNDSKIWLERNEYVDMVYESLEDSEKVDYPAINEIDTFDNMYTAISTVVCYVLPLWYDAFIYDSSTKEYTWSMIECEYGSLKFTNKFNDDAKLSNLGAKLLLDLGGTSMDVKLDAKFTYGDAVIPTFDKSQITYKDFILKSLDETEPRTKVSFKINPDVVFYSYDSGIVKIENPTTEYRFINLETEQSNQKFDDDGGIALFKNGDKLTEGVDFEISDRSITFNNDIKKTDIVYLIWNFEEDQSLDFSFVLDNASL